MEIWYSSVAIYMNNTCERMDVQCKIFFKINSIKFSASFWNYPFKMSKSMQLLISRSENYKFFPQEMKLLD